MHPTRRVTHKFLQLVDLVLPTSGRDKRLGQFLDQVAAKKLDENSTAGRHQRVVEGRTSIVRRWDTEHHGVLFARGWKPSRIESPAQAHATVNRLVAGSGLHVPDLLLVDDSLKTAVQWRLEVAIETAARGLPIDELMRNDTTTPGRWERIIATFGEHLARLHALSGRDWGAPWLPNNEMADPKKYWRRRLKRLASRLENATRVLKPAQVRSELEILTSRIEALPFDRPALVHGDLAMTHVFVIFENDNPVLSLIDLATVHYGHPAEDLNMLRGNALPKGSFDLLMKSYAAAGGTIDSSMTEAMKVFGLVRHWEKLNSRVGQLLRLKAGKSAKRRRQLEAEQIEVEQKIEQSIVQRKKRPA